MNEVIVSGLAVIPSKLVCIGRNYVAHIEELGNEVPAEMVVFNKPNSALGDTLHAELDEPLHYEGELAFIINGGQPTAVGFGLDLTKRALQSRLKDKGLPWERAKAFDGSALFSEFVSMPAEPGRLSLELRVDGRLRQAGGVELMIYKPATILEQLATFMTLENGDIIMTGTPAGVGPVRPGERFEGRVLDAGQTLLSSNWLAV